MANFEPNPRRPDEPHVVVRRERRVGDYWPKPYKELLVCALCGSEKETENCIRRIKS